MNKLQKWIVPAVLGLAAFLTGVSDYQRNKKIDELIEKVDSIENDKEENK